jgi:hypothetical protein
MTETVGYYGQSCPVCNIALALVQTKSKAGAAQYALRCYTHGRKTDYQTTAALARAATVDKTLPWRVA